MQLLPRLLRKSFADLERETGPDPTFSPNLVRVLIEVLNPAVAGL